MEAKFKTLEYSKDKNLKIYIVDDFFDYSEKFKFYTFALNSQFKFNRGNSNLPEDKVNKYQLASVYNDELLREFGLFKKIKNILSSLSLDNFFIGNSKVNACNSFDVYDYHIDCLNPTSMSILYYLNMTWNSEWEGDTKFSYLNSDEVFYSSNFKPGRIIIFNSCIPHKSSPPSTKAPFTRFSFSSTLREFNQSSHASVEDITK